MDTNITLRSYLARVHHIPFQDDPDESNQIYLFIAHCLTRLDDEVQRAKENLFQVAKNDLIAVCFVRANNLLSIF